MQILTLPLRLLLSHLLPFLLTYIPFTSCSASLILCQSTEFVVIPLNHY